MKKNHTKNTDMRILVIRTSAMGDVALLTPVLRALKSKYPGVEVILVTRKAFNIFFSFIPGLKIMNPDFSGRHKGLLGIWRLCSDIIKTEAPDLVVDLHNVVRSRVMSLFFSIRKVRTYAIDKGRTEKRDVIRGRNKGPLKHTTERYSDTFGKAGFVLEPFTARSAIITGNSSGKTGEILSGRNLINIGVAPFAKHSLKEWPVSSMEKLLLMVYRKTPCNFIFFGGQDESGRITELCRDIPNSLNLAGKVSLGEELGIMSTLEFMIAMDSSNMHMAALVGTKVISLWGATDPVTGFSPWMQPESYTIRIPADELDCRPCTVYGKGKCKRGDFACMAWLTPEMVFERIVNLKLV